MRRELKGLPHVVIIGGGFGGLRAARELAGKPVRVTLVDRNNYHLFQPLLYQVATASVSGDEITYPIRAALRKDSKLSFFLGEVQSIILEEKRVITNNGDLIYDFLIIAVGGETNFFGLESVEKNGFGLKDLDDATNIRNHLLKLFETAVYETDRKKCRALLTFVIVGGGPTGVECAGALSELIRIVLRKDYPTLDVDDVKIILLEALDRLLLAMPEELGKATARVLERKQVEVRFNAVVADYDGEVVRLKDGTEIPAHTVIWSAGVRASRLLDTLGLEQDRAGRVKVTPTLQVPGFPNVFVIGDAAHLEDEEGKPLPMIAPVAIQQAPVAAENIINLLKGKPLKHFRYRDPGIMATIGRNQAVAYVWGMKIRGFPAWIMWVVVHIFQLIGFRNRLAVLLDWAWSYLFYDRASRIIGPL